MNDTVLNGTAPKALELTFSLGITYFSMLIMALIPIVVGSFMSVFKEANAEDKEVMSKHVWIFEAMRQLLLIC